MSQLRCYDELLLENFNRFSHSAQNALSWLFFGSGTKLIKWLNHPNPIITIGELDWEGNELPHFNLCLNGRNKFK
jgi:hypothetical protein